MKIDLNNLPPRIRSLPTQNGYPVPWFVPKVNGVYDFRLVDGVKLIPTIKKELCYICGQKMGAHRAFIMGPMSVINRVVPEPPSHRDCAQWSLQVCPYLAYKQESGRDGKPIGSNPSPSGFGINSHPKTYCLWITKSYQIQKIQPDPARNIQGGLLFHVGDSTETVWYRESRLATRAEVLADLKTAYEYLRLMVPASNDQEINRIAKRYEAAKTLLPEVAV
jgi:hypothetical protein